LKDAYLIGGGAVPRHGRRYQINPDDEGFWLRAKIGLRPWRRYCTSLKMKNSGKRIF